MKNLYFKMAKNTYQLGLSHIRDRPALGVVCMITSIILAFFLIYITIIHASMVLLFLIFIQGSLLTCSAAYFLWANAQSKLNTVTLARTGHSTNA